MLKKLNELKRKYPKWSLPTKIGILLSIISVFIGILSILPPEHKKKGYLSIISETDIHLGDNIYPDIYGVSYNPLTQDIYPQLVNGIIFFDKKSKTFKSDNSGPTRIGQDLVNKISNKIIELDYSSYLYIFATNPGDTEYENLTKKFKESKQLFYLGPTALIASTDLKGNFYNRYVAIAFVKAFSIISTLQNAQIDENQDNLKATIIIKSYHGGIRQGQSENFILKINDYETTIPSKTRAMRDPVEVSIDIPLSVLHFDRPNYLSVYVLPWVEDAPVLKINNKDITPVHFRDVGIIKLGLSIQEE